MQAHKRLDYTRLLIRQEGPRYDPWALAVAVWESPELKKLLKIEKLSLF